MFTSSVGTRYVPRFDHQLERVVVDPVGVLDSVAPGLDGSAQRRPAGGMGADMDALLVRLVAGGFDLVDGHLEAIGLRIGILAERDARVELDEVGAALELRAHAGAEPDRARRTGQVMSRNDDVIGPARLVHVAARDGKPHAAGLDPRTLHVAAVHGVAQVDDRAARRMHVPHGSEAVQQRISGVFRRAQRDQRIGHFGVLGAKRPLVEAAAIGEVDMHIDEARESRSRSGASIICAPSGCAEVGRASGRDDAVALDEDRRILEGLGAGAVDKLCQTLMRVLMPQGPFREVRGRDPRRAHTGR